MGKENKSQQAKPQQSDKQELIKEYSSQNLSTAGAFGVRGYKQICTDLFVSIWRWGFFGSKNIIKIRADNVSYAEYEFQSQVNGR